MRPKDQWEDSSGNDAKTKLIYYIAPKKASGPKHGSYDARDRGAATRRGGSDIKNSSLTRKVKQRDTNPNLCKLRREIDMSGLG